MAITVSSITNNGPAAGGTVQKQATATFDSSYATGGEALAAADLGFSRIISVQVNPSAGYVFEWVASTGKIKAYWVDTTVDGAAMAEVTATTDLSAVAPTIEVLGLP